MDIRWIKTKLRGLIPVSFYPLLAPFYRWKRRRTIRGMERQDADFFRSHPEVVVPGAELRYNVVGGYDIASFLESGRRTATDIETALVQAGTSIKSVRRVLDFGCGCGRLLLEAVHRWPHASLSGSDVDERAIRWLAENMTDAKVMVNAPFPPLPVPDGHFDLIWCGSVFTHLDEAQAYAWLGELRRILAPGGYLLASVHGPHCWSSLPAATIKRIRERGFVFSRTVRDEGIHPDWYQTAWHTEAYVRDHWSKFMEIVTYLPRGFAENQDLFVGKARPEVG